MQALHTSGSRPAASGSVKVETTMAKFDSSAEKFAAAILGFDHAPTQQLLYSPHCFGAHLRAYFLVYPFIDIP
jgi:hypothetical protein